MTRQKTDRAKRDTCIMLYMFKDVVEEIDKIAIEKRIPRCQVIYKFIDDGLKLLEQEKQ